MADRYWVGGTASWDATAGTKWSATDGGAGGASLPTTSDDVFFTAASGTVTCTIVSTRAAKSINCTGFTGTIAGTGAITVAGSVTLVSGMSYTHTGIMTFTGTATLTTAGKTFSAITINGSGITVQLADALTSSGNITLTQGTFTTNNYNVTALALVSSNSNIRTINLGSSTFNLSALTAINFATSTNLTFNSGTSQINLSLNNAILNGGGKTFYNVSFTATAGNRSITGANTFNNLNFTAPTTPSAVRLSFSGDQTVTGTLTCDGASAIQRVMLLSNTQGTARTITAAAVSANDCDFRAITISGAAAPIAPTRAGDCGGNSGITFPSPKNVYRVGTENSWQGSSSWSLTSGGTGSDDNFPLAQDTAIINEDTALTGNLGFSSAFNISALDASARTSGITLNHDVQQTRYGSYTLGSGVTVAGTSNQFFSGRSTQTFTSAGKTITFPITVESIGGSLQLGDAFSSSSTISLTTGTFDAATYNVTCTRLVSNNSNTRTINMGSGLWTITGTGTVWDFTDETRLTLNKGTADILLSDTSTTSRIFASGTGLSYNKLTIGGATGTSTLTLQAGATFGELASTKTVAHTILLQGTATKTFNTWSVTGTVGNVVTVQSNTAGTQRTNSITNVTSGIDYLAVKDIAIVETNRFYVGANSTNNGNNTNVIFTASPVTASNSNFFLMFG